MQLFHTNGAWYKGNLHMHTTLSDGKRSPEEAAQIYRNAGYDFIALTDHWVQSETRFSDKMLLLSGCEWDTGDMVNDPIYHIVGIGMQRPVGLKPLQSRPPQEIIDAIRSAGGIAILAHPAWSVTDPDKCLELEGLSGAEIYNSVSGLPWNVRPDSSLYFDIWASQGKLIRCMAADDSHFYEGEQTRSFLMVNARGLTREAIMEAIAGGNFYASQGPRFENISVADGRITVKCSRVETVEFYSNTVWCDDRVTTGGTDSAEYVIKPTDIYVRVELIDADGNHAWSSPFAV